MESVVELRRDFHKHAEVGFTEFRTASRVVTELQGLGYEVLWGHEAMVPEAKMGTPEPDELEAAFARALRDGADAEILEKMRGGNTAVVATLTRGSSGKVVAFRFDMDALPVEESDSADHVPKREGFRSVYERNMHACGHDGHTAIGLKFAEAMAGTDFVGTLKLVFQPSEEGGRGARPIAEKGMVDDVDRIYALHLGQNLPAGRFAAGSEGWFATSKLKSVFTGVPAHASGAPQMGRNALVAAATALLNIQSIPRSSVADTRINVGKLVGGTAPNIIAHRAEMISETRSRDEEVNADLEARLRKIVDHSGQMHGVEATTELIGQALPIHCDEDAMDVAKAAVADVPYFDDVRDKGKGTGSEDCSVLIKRVQELGGKGTYMRVFSPTAGPGHNSSFDFDESTLQPSVELCIGIATRELV